MIILLIINILNTPHFDLPLEAIFSSFNFQNSGSKYLDEELNAKWKVAKQPSIQFCVKIRRERKTGRGEY